MIAMSNSNYRYGRNFEYSVCKKFEKTCPIVKRSYGSKGVWDIIAIRKFFFLSTMTWRTQVFLIQCKKEKKKTKHDEEKKALRDLADNVLAMPIWAEKDWSNGRIKLISLLNNKPYDPGKRFN